MVGAQRCGWIKAPLQRGGGRRTKFVHRWLFSETPRLPSLSRARREVRLTFHSSGGVPQERLSAGSSDSAANAASEASSHGLEGNWGDSQERWGALLASVWKESGRHPRSTAPRVRLMSQPLGLDRISSSLVKQFGLISMTADYGAIAALK